VSRKAPGLWTPVKCTVFLPLALTVGTVLETFDSLCGIRGEPPLTWFLARELSTAHWYNLEAGRRDLGYSPRICIEEACDNLLIGCAPARANGPIPPRG
jgi:2-alkyl-3-oxoalkanoate reductase